MSSERVTCVVLIVCGLSLEVVAEVDQKGPSGEGGAKAGFEETTELLKWRYQDFPGCPAFLDVQWLCLWASHAGGTTSMLYHRVNIHIQCSTGKIYQMQIPLWPKSVSCTVVRKWSQEICDTQREASVWEQSVASSALTHSLLFPIEALRG